MTKKDIPFWTKFCTELVYGGHLASLAAPAFVWTMALMLRSNIAWPLLVIAYLVPQIIYSYNHFRELKIDLQFNPERAGYLQEKLKHSPYLFALYGSTLLVLLVAFSNVQTCILVLVLISGGILYTTHFKSLTQKITGFKNVYVATFWALQSTALYPFYYNLRSGFFYILFFLFVWLRTFLNTVFFDIKDVDSDRKQGLKTLPVLFGKTSTLNYLHLFNLLSLVPIAVGVLLGIFPLFALSVTVFCFYSIFYIERSRVTTSERLRKLSYIMADGEYILVPFVVLIAKLFLW